MSQPEDWGVPEAGPSTPQAFAGRINDSLDALLSLHKGGARPSYAVAGTMWIDDTATPWVLNQYDGDTDIKIAEIDQSTHKVKLFAEEAAFVGDVTVGGYNLRRSRGEPYPGNPTDFNDMTAPGFYNTSGSGWSNGPLGSGTHTGSLEVLGRSSGSHLVQIWRSHNDGSHYVRAFDNQNWRSWSRVADGYETGTFTPSYGGSSSNPTITHDIQLGKYTKIGDQVGFTLTLGTDSVSGGSGNLRVLGLPFSAHSTYGASGHVGSAFSFSTVPVVWYLDGGWNYIELRTTSNSSALASVSALATGANSNRLGISGIYFTS